MYVLLFIYVSCVCFAIYVWGLWMFCDLNMRFMLVLRFIFVICVCFAIFV